MPSDVAYGCWREWLKKKTGKKKVKKAVSRRAALKALKAESERALIDQIRRLQALPMNQRTHFLRVRHPGGGSHI
jgi:hypothetical protein